MMFGNYVRKQRLARQKNDRRRYSLRGVANRIGMQPSYLSKVERGIFKPPSEKLIVALAEDLEEDSDVLLSLADKVAKDLQAVILTHPALYGALIRRFANDARLRAEIEPKLVHA
jgi:HTH-type transcriptional regulator, competence development regulator